MHERQCDAENHIIIFLSTCYFYKFYKIILKYYEISIILLNLIYIYLTLLFQSKFVI